jgi:hypothetical protein
VLEWQSARTHIAARVAASEAAAAKRQWERDALTVYHRGRGQALGAAEDGCTDSSSVIAPATVTDPDSSVTIADILAAVPRAAIEAEAHQRSVRTAAFLEARTRRFEQRIDALIGKEHANGSGGTEAAPSESGSNPAHADDDSARIP